MDGLQTEAAKLAAPSIYWHCQTLYRQGRLDQAVEAGELVGEHCLTPTSILRSVDTQVLEVAILAEVARMVLSSTEIALTERLALGGAVGNRVTALLQANPNLADPKTKVVIKGARQDKSMSLLAWVIRADVQLDPDHLEAAVETAPALRKFFELTMAQEEMPCLYGVLYESGAASLLPRALLRVLPERWRDLCGWKGNLTLPMMCGYALRTGYGLEQSLRLIDELKSSMRRTNTEPCFLPWNRSNLADELVKAMAGEHPARTEHPVTFMLYAALESSAWLDRSKELGMPQSEGYPAAPLKTVAAALNSLMAPADRLEFDAIPAAALLQTVALSPLECTNRAVSAYWFGHRTQELPSGTPKDFLAWLVDHVDGAGNQVQAEDVISRRRTYEKAIGVAATAALISTLTARSMSLAIDSDSALSQSPPVAIHRSRGL